MLNRECIKIYESRKIICAWGANWQLSSAQIWRFKGNIDKREAKGHLAVACSSIGLINLLT